MGGGGLSVGSGGRWCLSRGVSSQRGVSAQVGSTPPSLWTQFLTQTCENITTVAGGKNGNIIFYLVKSALILEAQAI